MTSTHTLARRGDRSTSFEAAARQTTRKRQHLYGLIMQTLTDAGPRTDEELLRRFARAGHAVTPSGVRSRRNELVLAGWVTELRDDDGKVVKRRGVSGSPCTVWRVVEPGEDHTLPEPRKSREAGAQGSPDHDAGLAAATRLASWELGDEDIAARIIAAYLDPQAAHATLDQDGAPR